MEEDIMLLENVIKLKKQGLCYEQELTRKFYGAIENLIARYKELEENLNYRVRYCNILEKELYGENSVELTKLEDKYFIPKSKVKEKIEKYNIQRQQAETEKINNMFVNYIDCLQELLEEG